MDNEKQIPIQYVDKPPMRLTPRAESLVKLGKRAAVIVLSLGAGAATGHIIGEATAPQFQGSATERIDNEQTVTDLAEHVDGVEKGNLNATVDKIVRDNPQVFQKGNSSIEYQDIGKDVTIPESVD